MDLPAKLEENEYLLKIRPANTGRYSSTEYPTGFLAKYTQKGELQKSFDEWGAGYYWTTARPDPLPIALHTEVFKSGWKLFGWRFGKSQNWAEMVHPDGFILEIYLTNFLDIVKETVIVKGELSGEFKWEKNKLIKN